MESGLELSEVKDLDVSSSLEKQSTHLSFFFFFKQDPIKLWCRDDRIKYYHSIHRVRNSFCTFASLKNQIKQTAGIFSNSCLWHLSLNNFQKRWWWKRKKWFILGQLPRQQTDVSIGIFLLMALSEEALESVMPNPPLFQKGTRYSTEKFHNLVLWDFSFLSFLGFAGSVLLGDLQFIALK